MGQLRAAVAKAGLRPLHAAVVLVLLVAVAFVLGRQKSERAHGSDAAGLRGVDGPTHCPPPSLSDTPPPSLLKRTYVPSDLERAWYRDISAISTSGRTCKVLATEQYDTFQQLIDALEAQEVATRATGSPAAVAAYHDAFHKLDPILSKMVYTDAVTGQLVRTVLLEPLVGLLRDPRPVCWNPKWPGQLRSRPFTPHRGSEGLEIMARQCLIDPHVGGLVSPAQPGAGAKSILLDVGGSEWKDRFGLPRLVGTYAIAGVSFEHIYAWEALPVTPSYFDSMPVDVKKRVHLYNMPASTACGHSDNPWTLLRAVAQAEDFVAVKIDIDTPYVELPLLQQLLADPSLSALVDELYFEHHVEMGAHEMGRWWRTAEGEARVAGTLDDSYKLFTQLREAGVLAHSWP